jgi:hypothetical protein
MGSETMKRIVTRCSLFATALIMTLGSPNAGFAQVESLNPNPLQPSGVGSGTVGGYSSRQGSGQMGLNVGPQASGGNENPADTLLRELNGPNYNRSSGKVRFRGPAVRAARRVDPAYGKFPTIEGGAVYFANRGEYEDRLYRPRQGSYRQTARTQTLRPVAPRAN